MSANHLPANTRLRYLYVDGNNYKYANACVVAGRLTPEQQAVILDCLDEGAYFVPSAVGLTEDRGSIPDPAADHSWFRLEAGFAEYTDDAPQCGMDAAGLTAKFVAVGPAGWDAFVRPMGQ